MIVKQNEYNEWIAYVYRNPRADWIVASGGKSKQEAIQRAKENFPQDSNYIIFEEQ